jgi:hypothetical protein
MCIWVCVNQPTCGIIEAGSQKDWNEKCLSPCLLVCLSNGAGINIKHLCFSLYSRVLQQVEHKLSVARSPLMSSSPINSRKYVHFVMCSIANCRKHKAPGYYPIKATPLATYYWFKQPINFQQYCPCLLSMLMIAVLWVDRNTFPKNLRN